jgi:cellobiose-specific phosphotransferase system component IIA
MIERDERLDSPLEQAVRQVARQCRHRRWIRCGFRFGLASLLLVLTFTFLLASLPQGGVPRSLARGLFILAEVAAAWFLLIRPLRDPIDLRRAALFMDEQRPELENRIVSAVEFSERTRDEQAAWLIERLLEDSQRAAMKIPWQDLLEGRRALRWAVMGTLAWLGVFGCVGLYRSLWVPDTVVHKLARLLPGERFEFTVEPGNTRVRRGDSAVVRVMSKQTAETASILWRESDGQWQTARMEEGASPKIHYHPFADLRADISYQVRLGSFVSEVYRIAVWTPPEVDSIDLTYHYPDYLHLPPTETAYGGDITAVEGTRVEVAVHVNKPLKDAQLALTSSPAIALRETQPNRWEGSLQVARNDVYRVKLTDLENAANEFVPEYRITAKPDNPPEVKIAFPRDDLEVTSLDEIPFEFTVDDDFGLTTFGLQVEVAGREPIRLPLGPQGAEALRTAQGRRTLMLETLNLKPGDLITWAVRANDGKPGRAEFETLGSPYFLEIRPFRREFEEAISNQSSQDRQQQQRQQGDRNQQASNQKEVLIATWNLRRDAKNLTQREFEERLSKIKEAQRGVQRQLAERGLESSPDDSVLPQALDAIEKALTALNETKWQDPSARLSEAIRQMQTAHRLLLKARPERSQVQMARNASGSQSQANRREIQQLELRRNRNFYEQERRVQQQRAATEAAVNDLKDLARRQNMINEEINKLISELQQNDPQRREELARQLERLREEERRALQQLDQAERNVATGEMENRQAGDTNRALQDARRQMTRSLDSMRRDQFQQARAAGSRAVQALGEAEAALQRLSREAAAQRIAELQRRVQAMGKREDGIRERIAELRQRQESPGPLREGEDSERARKEVVAEKNGLAQEFGETLKDAADLAKGAETSQELMARRLGDWLRQTSREGIPEQIKASRPFVEFGLWDPAVKAEEQIREKLARTEKNLANVAEGAVADDLEGMRRALEELRRLREGERDLRRAAQAQGDQQPSGDRPDKSSRPEREQAAAPDSRPSNDQANARGSRTPGASSNERSPSRGQSADAADERAGWNDWLAPRSNEQMRRFLERDSQGWVDRIREAEALLPDEGGVRRELGRAREAILSLRRNYRGLTSKAEGPPRFDLLKEMVGVPLGLAAAELERQIRKQEDAEKLTLTEEDVVPVKYRKRVADYYEALSESKGK